MDERTDHHDEMIDQIIDEAQDAGRAPDPTPDLRRDVDLQLKIDHALRTHFALPSDAGLDADINGALKRCFAPPAGAEVETSKAPHPFPRRLIALAAAAAILLTVGITIFVLTRPAELSRMEQAYADHTATDFVNFSCETPDQFQTWVTDNFEQPVRPVVGDEPLTFIGWNYDNVVSQYSGVMLGKARGRDIIVILDKADGDADFALNDNSDLHLHRAEVGDLVFYEVSPFDKPLFLPTFKLVP